MVLNRGMLSVQFDLDSKPEDQFEVLEAEELDDPRDEGLVELNPVLDDPKIERVIIGREKEEEMLREQRTNWANGDYLTNYQRTLREVWSNMTMALYDCTYRISNCDGCEDGFDHTDCSIERWASHDLSRGWRLTNGRDRHYLNEEGNCVACSEFKGLWPDDDDEGDIEEEPAEE
jgi:hypothetical protein